MKNKDYNTNTKKVAFMSVVPLMVPVTQRCILSTIKELETEQARTRSRICKL